MQTNITFRNLEASEAIKTYARDKVDRVHKYLSDGGFANGSSEAHIVLSVDRHLQQADITVHTGHYFLRGREVSSDLYASIDLAMDKIERQLKRYKGKIKERRARPHHDQAHLHLNHAIVDTFEEPVEEPKLVEVEQFAAKPMSIDEAVMQMDLGDSEFLVFQNARSREVNVMYRRQDGKYGLIEAKTK